MRKAIGGLVVLAALGAPAAASAQSGTVNATATIVGALTVVNSGDLDFGAIVPGTGAVVAPGAAAGAGQSLGHLRIDHSSNFTVSSTVPTQLTGPDVIDVTFECGYSAAQNGALTGGSFDCAAPNASPATVLGTATVTYLQVGGTILGGDTTGKPAGTYTGSLTFTFTPTL